MPDEYTHDANRIVLRRLGRRVRAHYDSVRDEPLPDRWIELMKALEAREQRGGEGDDDPRRQRR